MESDTKIADGDELVSTDGVLFTVDLDALDWGPEIEFADEKLQTPEVSYTLICLSDLEWEPEIENINREVEIKNADTAEVEIEKVCRKKRVRNEQGWKRNVDKHKRLRGEEHPAANNMLQTVRKREMKPSCDEACRICETIIPENQRRYLFEQFWSKFTSWQQRDQYISSLTEVCIIILIVGPTK